jgi:hypothetical protein
VLPNFASGAPSNFRTPGLRRVVRAAACLYMARANPGARPYREMLGEVVLKHFEGHGTFMGTIIEYDEQTGFRIQVTPSA